MTPEQNPAPIAATSDPAPHATIVVHDDSEQVWENILKGLQAFELLSPFIVSIISATQTKTVTVQPKPAEPPQPPQ